MNRFYYVGLQDRAEDSDSNSNELAVLFGKALKMFISPGADGTLKKSWTGCSPPALPQQVEDVVSESVSVLLQHPPHVVHHLQRATRGRQGVLWEQRKEDVSFPLWLLSLNS